MFRSNKRLVGFDLGERSAKAVEVTLKDGQAVLTGIAAVDFEEGQFPAHALETALDEAGIRPGRAVASLAGPGVQVRYMSLIDMEDDELRQAACLLAERYLPFSCEEAILDVQRIPGRKYVGGDDGGASGSEGNQVAVAVAACKRAIVEERVETLIALGFMPQAVDVGVSALGTAWERLGGDTSANNLALVDVGARRTSFHALVEGNTCFSRELDIGGDDMTEALARRLGLISEEADAWKRGVQGDPGDVRRALAPVIEDLANEVALSLDFVENREGVRVDEVQLCGGGSLTHGVLEAIATTSRRPVHAWNPMERLTIDAKRVDPRRASSLGPRLAVAIGLALREGAA